MSTEFININGGFPPLNIIDNNIKKKKEKEIKKERFYSPNNLNILKILNTKKEQIIENNNNIEIIDSL